MHSFPFLRLVSWSLLVLGACAKSPPVGPDNGGGASGGAPAIGQPIQANLTIATATPTPRTSTAGVNYWCWAPTYVDSVTGTESMVSALAPGFVRVGGHNNDNNKPDPFSPAQIDRAVSYARAVGGELILQVPLLGDETGGNPSAATAAAMVTYANVTKGYGIKYFAIGNEPDLYPDQEATRPGYKPADFCTSAREFVTAMKAVDPTIKLVGPDLSWKYQPSNDWMTPILMGCGDLFDVVAFHRYPFAPAASTAAAAQGDAPALRNTVAAIRAIMRATGQGDKPLALTETNITYDGAPEKSTLDASPGTLPAGLWTADMLGTALGEGLWTTLFWSVSEGWTLGLVDPSMKTPRPAYHALRMFAEHFGPTLVPVSGTPAGVRAYASRDAAGATTQIIVVNWNASDLVATFTTTGTQSPVAPVAFNLRARSFSAVEIPDVGPPSAWTYGAAEWSARTTAAVVTPTPKTP